MNATSFRGVSQRRHGYKPVANQSWPYSDPVSGLVKSAIERSQKQDQLAQNTFIKRKSNGDLQIVKVVNNLLRNTVLITYPRSTLNESRIVVVDYKRYRHNTVDQFGQPSLAAPTDRARHMGPGGDRLSAGQNKFLERRQHLGKGVDAIFQILGDVDRQGSEVAGG